MRVAHKVSQKVLFFLLSLISIAKSYFFITKVLIPFNLVEEAEKIFNSVVFLIDRLYFYIQ